MTHDLDTLAYNLEEAIDKGITLEAILETLAMIATFKAEHIEQSYQDTVHAKKWDKLASRLETLAISKPVASADKLLESAQDNH